MGPPGRYGIWVVATGPTSTGRRSKRNACCVLETSCASASHGWSTWWQDRLTNRSMRPQSFPTPPQLPPRLTRREFDVLVVLCRPLVSDDPFPEPASVRADGRRAVRHRGGRQTASAEPVRQVRHPRRGRPPGPAGQRGAPARVPSRSPSCATAALSEVEGLDGRDRTFVRGPVGAPDAVHGRADRGYHLAVHRSVDRRQRGPFSSGDVVHLDRRQHRVGSSPPTTTIRPSMNAAP